MNPFLKNILYRIKKHNMRVQLYNVVLFLAEMKRFELLRRFEADLPHFECGPFNHLGTSPNFPRRAERRPARPFYCSPGGWKSQVFRWNG